MKKVKIKFCGLSRIEDIEFVNELKPDYIGFVFAKSKRQVSVEQAIVLKEKLNKDILTVGVFVNEDVKKIVSLLDKGIIDIAQLHGSETEEDILKIKELSGKPVIKAIKVKETEDIRKWINSKVDYLLLDSGAGTGKVFNWNIIKNIKREFFLAGGLNRENIEEAILKVSPMAIDLSSGIESEGLKDFNKMKEIMVKVGRIDE